MDSGKCGQEDDVNLGMCGPGNAWTQGRVGLGTFGLVDDADFGHVVLRAWTWGQCGL